MKKFYILLIALFMLSGAMAQWVPQNSGTTKNLRSVHFTDANTGYAVGDSGTILKTNDGGNNWGIQSSGITHELHSVYFPSVNLGFAVGSGYIVGVGGFGFILKTINGGTTWSLIYSSDTIPGNGCAFNSVFFTDANTGYAVGGFSNNVEELNPLIRKTTDGGINWTIQSPGMEIILNSVYFTDSNIGYTVGDKYSYGGIILKTINGGSSWTLQNYDTAYSICSVFFTNADTGYAVGNHWDWWTGGNSIILKTINGGISWSVSVLGQIDGLRLNSIFFTDENTGYAVGRCCFEGVKIIYNTTDGGMNWTSQMYSLGEISSVYFPNADTGYSVGSDGIILKTTNGGVGINDQHQTAHTITIYPNPTLDKVTISTPTTPNRNTFMTIFNINGQVILSRQIKAQQMAVDVSGLSQGIYLVKVTDDRTVMVGKFVKN